MPGLTLSNEFISRDESLHTEFAVLLYSQLPKDQRLSADNVYDIIREAVDIENEFINESIPCNLLGMNQLLMTQYIQFVADRLIVQLGYEPIYNVNNPFHFMDRISLTNKTNFFEHTRQSEYAIARVGNTKEDNSFSLDADF
jgi:ribonucleotide reductase beta subunit family protein with ferritin-like domain